MAIKEEKKTTQEVEIVEEGAKEVPSKKKEAKKADKFDATKVDMKGLERMRKELAEYRLAIIAGKEKDTSKVREMRKNIARVMTNINKK